MKYFYLVAKIDGTCWTCGRTTFKGVDTVVSVDNGEKYVCTDCFVPPGKKPVAIVGPCHAITKTGAPCPIDALPNNEYCHVHEPSLRCGIPKKKTGEPCGVTTGGGPCKFHRK